MPMSVCAYRLSWVGHTAHMATRDRSLSTIWAGLLFTALLGALAYSAFADGRTLVGAVFSVLGLLVIAVSLRRPPKDGPSLRTNVAWSGVGFLVAGVAFTTLAVRDDEPVRAALAGIAGACAIFIAIFAAYLLWKGRHVAEPSDEPDPETAT